MTLKQMPSGRTPNDRSPFLRARAPAKVNLTLHVLGRRADGFHELDSLVAFAGCAADALTLELGPTLSLTASGPFADAAGEGGDNLVLKAAREASARIPDLTLGRFALVKRIPVAAGLGGGSADAAAALRLIAEANGLDANDPRLVEAAAATGSDVPVCLASRAARMTGRGEAVAPLDGFEPVAAVLANPLKPVSTAEIFRRLGLKADERFDSFPLGATPLPPSLLRGGVGGGGGGGSGHGDEGDAALTRTVAVPFEPPPPLPSPQEGGGGDVAPLTLIDALLSGRNDLEPPARALLPDIFAGITALAASENCRLARMSGSGATVFGLFDDQRSARRAARALKAELAGWWVAPTMLR